MEMLSQLKKLKSETVSSAAGDQPLYVARQKIQPKSVSGRFRQLKWMVMLVTLGIYYLTPWLRWDRGPFAPDQAVLLDLSGGRFYFFFIEIWPQELFYVAGLLIMAGIGLFLVTSTVGRAWCGYACPQTVWVDLFLAVERFIEGDRNARIKLDQAPLDLRKATLRTAKHAVWLLIAVATGGAWIFYFADAPTLARAFITGEAPPVAYITVAVLTATTYTFGGLMREQVCIYMCPWPRIQAAMLDESSLTVTYNDWRGEPRSRHTKRAMAAGESIGDCVDCSACVAVCPMGIDIRNGQQMACITCALCIDACDGVMDKLGKERGLISYATFRDYDANMAIATSGGTAAIDPARVRGGDGKLIPEVAQFRLGTLLRPRTLVYVAMWSLIGLIMLYALMTRARLDVSVLSDRNPQYVILSDGAVRNGYTVKLLNMIPERRTLTLSLDGLPGATMMVGGMNQPESRTAEIEVEPDRLKAVRVFVRQPAEMIHAEKQTFKFVVEDHAGEGAAYTATFSAPGGRK